MKPRNFVTVLAAVAVISSTAGFAIANLSAANGSDSIAKVAGGGGDPVAALTFKAQSICGPVGKTSCTVGSIGPGGGTIFFVDWHNEYSGFDYLETAPADWSADRSSVDPLLPWCDNAIRLAQGNINNWINRAVGKGKSNTSTMLKICGSGAANAVDDFNKSSRTTFHDWFLPSLGELMWMANGTQGLAGLSSTEYWSSSEYSNEGGWVESVSRGYQGSAGKTNALAVRPIRAF
jgi:hypothetical protein